MIYACESYAAAMLEKLAQWNGVFPENQHFVEIGIPRGVSYEAVPGSPINRQCRQDGDAENVPT